MGKPVSILWYRHCLRLHDNPALIAAINCKDQEQFMPIFIFDGESAGTKLVGYNRMRFLLESLEDLDNSFKKFGGKLSIFRGKPLEIFAMIQKSIGISKICFDQDCESIWKNRDDQVKAYCKENKIELIEAVSHTLWNPADILEANGGSPPLTYAAFMFVTSTLGKPMRPLEVPTVELSATTYFEQSWENLLSPPLLPEDFGLYMEEDTIESNIRHGGERYALELLNQRLDNEKSVFMSGYILPNQSNPDLLLGGASLSPALRFGTISVRKFFWSIHDVFSTVVEGNTTSIQTITGQLIWREYFYIMSVKNPHYDQMIPNPICLKIPWRDLQKPEVMEEFSKWKNGKTGYPFIDATMRQLRQEGWIHHVARNAVATFLTRGDLWISWEAGLQHFLKYLLDADWSVCAGNWMWVSSSAFENALNCTNCICPTNYAQRLDPQGLFIRQYIPELRDYEPPYIFEPWKTPKELQADWKCLIGTNYPEPMVNHQLVSKRNKDAILRIRQQLMSITIPVPEHIHPSDEQETKSFMAFPEDCVH